MKVAVVTDYFPISSHPWAGHSAYQTLRLLANICDVHVFYPETVYPSFIKRVEGKVGAVDRGWRPPGVSTTYISFPAFPVLTRPLNGFTSAYRLLPYVRRYQPDVVLNYAVYPHGLAAVRIARGLGIPAVITAIGSDLNRMSDPLCAWLTRQTLRKADFVTTVSHDLAKTAGRLGAVSERTRAILNGCDTTIFHPRERVQCRVDLGLDPEAEIVLYVGRLDLRKGLKELVEAVVSLRPMRSKMHCYMIGDGPAKAELAAAIEQHKASASITLLPSCLTERIAMWMGAANLVTLPSYAEGCPNVVIEALSAGRPVVASNVGGIPELMDDNSGKLVPAHHAKELSDGLNEVLDRTWDADAISSRHSRSWLDVAQELHAILNELVSLRTARYLSPR